MSTLDLEVLQQYQSKDALIQGSLRKNNKYLLTYSSLTFFACAENKGK